MPCVLHQHTCYVSGCASRRTPRTTCLAHPAHARTGPVPALAVQTKGFGPPAVSQPDVNPALPPVPHLDGKSVRANWNATALAYLGDSVWELYVRRHFFFPPGRLVAYYDGVTSQVRAETQETYYELLLAGQFIDEEERSVLRWGRNAKVNIPPRFKASGKHGETYKHATAMECLAGYLYLTNPPRLHQLMVYLGLGGSNAI